MAVSPNDSWATAWSTLTNRQWLGSSAG
jgi:hypothetical protein